MSNYSLQPQQSDLGEIKDVPVKNFLTVTDWFCRGGQPSSAAIEVLVKQGFRTIISLRWNANTIKKERELAKQYGLNFYSIPLSYWRLPSRKEIDFFLSIVDDNTKHPIFMHCLHGRDRTGMLTAIYRIARENWTADQAYAEMKSSGFHHIRMHQFKWAVYGFEKRLNRDKK